MDWQTIETAPTEKFAEFLGWSEGAGITICYVGYHNGERRFYDSEALEHCNYIRAHPTHWMPLPAPPSPPPEKLR